MEDAFILIALIIPIIALFLVPKTLKWTTQGLSSLAQGALGVAGKMGAGATKAGKQTASAGVKKGKAAAYEAKDNLAAAQFGKGNKRMGTLLAGKLPTAKGMDKAAQQMGNRSDEKSKEQQRSLSYNGNTLEGIDMTDDSTIKQSLIDRGLSENNASKQAKIISAAIKRTTDAGKPRPSSGYDLYGAELAHVSAGGTSELLGANGGNALTQQAAIAELAQRGDYQVLKELRERYDDPDRSGGISQSTMLAGIQPSIADAATKAPDLVKGDAGAAFDNISADKFAAMDSKTAVRYVDYVNSQGSGSAAAKNLANIHGAFNAPGSTLRQKTDAKFLDAMKNIKVVSSTAATPATAATAATPATPTTPATDATDATPATPATASVGGAGGFEL